MSVARFRVCGTSNFHHTEFQAALHESYVEGWKVHGKFSMSILTSQELSLAEMQLRWPGKFERTSITHFDTSVVPADNISLLVDTWMVNLNKSLLEECFRQNPSTHDVMIHDSTQRRLHTTKQKTTANVATKCNLHDEEINVTKIREFNNLLANPATRENQNRRWSQHSLLSEVPDPYCSGPLYPERYNGKQLRYPLFGPKCPKTEPAFMRCNQTPGVDRNATPRIPGEWPICESLLLKKRPQILRRPLAYSFGIANDFSFDDRLADLGFEVHSFDPTVRYRKQHEAHRHEHVHFHHMGLQSSIMACRSTAAKSGGTYGGLDGELLSLSQIRTLLGHNQRKISVLKLDCEGCEWDAFYEMSRTDPLALMSVHMILIEIHLSRSLKIQSTVDMRKMQEFYHHVIETHGFQLFYHHSNHGRPPDRFVIPQMIEAGARQGMCCYELGLVKPSRST